MLLGSVAQAHPGVSIVMDSRGVVYYTDLVHVWKILPDGTKQIAVREVHTHELYLDADDNLYGEHVAYEGEATDTWNHRVWRLSPDGTLTNTIPTRSGHPVDFYDYSFVRDGQGTLFRLRRGDAPEVVLVTGGEQRALPIRLGSGDIGWGTFGHGAFYFTRGDALLRLDPTSGTMQTVAEDLIERTLVFRFVGRRHALMGLWTDAEANVYVSVFSGQVVKRITPDGIVTVVAETSGLWSPAGGLVAPDGALWLLEYSSGNEARVRRLAADGTATVF